MATYKLEESELSKLKGKTIIITGGSSGIGKSTVEIAHKHGANVIIADWNEKDGKALASELKDHVIFHQTDVSSWDSVISLFEAAMKTFGHVDVVLGNAGIATESDFFAPNIDSATGLLAAPSLKTLDVNLTGAVYTTKAAIYYLEKSGSKGQIVLTGSAASFLDTPPGHLYCASKAGILGFVRSLRTQLIREKNITINMVAPWLTRTPMAAGNNIEEFWGDLPINEPWGVAHALLLPVVRPEMNGRSLFVSGHTITDFEEGLEKTQPQWMGEKLSEDVNKGQEKMLRPRKWG